MDHGVDRREADLWAGAAATRVCPGLTITPRAPFLGGPVELEVSGTVPSRAERDAVVKALTEECARTDSRRPSATT
jgi:hypothetical protein